jgi:influenza virus NS1A-binding protein
MISPLQEQRRALSAVALPDGVYAIGGYDGKEYLSSVERYDLDRKAWVKVASMNIPRCTLSAVASPDC